MTNSRQKGARGVMWRSVKGYEGLYEASTDGEVRSIARRTTKGGKVLFALMMDRCIRPLQSVPRHTEGQEPTK